MKADNSVLTQQQVGEIVRQYMDGKSMQQLADLYYVSKPTIGNYLKAAGVPMRSKGGNNNPTGYCGSWSKHSIAKEHND